MLKADEISILMDQARENGKAPDAREIAAQYWLYALYPLERFDIRKALKVQHLNSPRATEKCIDFLAELIKQEIEK
jgi:hypothetical protein